LNKTGTQVKSENTVALNRNAIGLPDKAFIRKGLIAAGIAESRIETSQVGCMGYSFRAVEEIGKLSTFRSGSIDAVIGGCPHPSIGEMGELAQDEQVDRFRRHKNENH
jgi:hypothetical protein